jgi:hypothetical protein
MKTVIKVTLLGCGAYVLTIVLAFATIVATLRIMQPSSCPDYSDTLALVWASLACVCLVSTAVVGVGFWRITDTIRGGGAATAVYGLIILFTYLFMALILMIGFNC